MNSTNILIDDNGKFAGVLNRYGQIRSRDYGNLVKTGLLDINPDAEVNTYKCFFLPENASDFTFDKYDYVIDAVDTVTAKIELVMQKGGSNRI